jgi:hypothetical protein
MANIYDMSDTWNDSGTTFTAIKMNVTDTASTSTSALMDLQIGGLSKFRVRPGIGKTGCVISNETAFELRLDNSIGALLGVFSGTNLVVDSVGIKIENTYIKGPAANVLEQRNGTNAQTFNLYNTYTDDSNYERARFQWAGNELRIGTEAAGTGSLRSIGLYIANVRYQIIGSGFNQFDQNLYMNGADIATSSGANGFKIGTASTQGLGFWGATPSAQPTAVADATDAASVITQLNALLSRMRTIGLIAT